MTDTADRTGASLSLPAREAILAELRRYDSGELTAKGLRRTITEIDQRFDANPHESAALLIATQRPELIQLAGTLVIQGQSTTAAETMPSSVEPPVGPVSASVPSAPTVGAVRTEAAPEAEPAQSGREPPPTPPPKARWRRWWPIAAAAAGLIAVTALLTSGGGGTTTVTGELVLTDAATASANCIGQGGYSDIEPGLPVVLTNENGKILGSTSLGAGTVNTGLGTCTYTFSFSSVRTDQEQYAVEASHRGKVVHSLAEMKAQGWSFHLSLGE